MKPESTNHHAILKMEFQRFPPRYYQVQRQKHSSGDASWHSRTEKLRKVQRVVSTYQSNGSPVLKSLARQLEQILGQPKTWGSHNLLS